MINERNKANKLGEIMMSLTESACDIVSDLHYGAHHDDRIYALSASDKCDSLVASLEKIVKEYKELSNECEKVGVK